MESFNISFLPQNSFLKIKINKSPSAEEIEDIATTLDLQDIRH